MKSKDILKAVRTKNVAKIKDISNPDKWSFYDWNAFVNNVENQKKFMEIHNEVIGKTTQTL